MTSGKTSASVRDVLHRVSAGLGAVVSVSLLLSVSQLPGALPLVLIALIAGTMWTIRAPSQALIGLVFAVPLVGSIGRLWAPRAAWAEMLVLAFAAGWFLRRRSQRSPDGLDGPIQLAAAVVASSVAVVTTFTQWRLTGEPVPRSWLFAYWQGYFLLDSPGNGIDAGMRLLESLLLLRAASLFSRDRSDWTPRFAAALAAGASIAGAMNVWEVWASVRDAPASLQAFVHAFAGSRLNATFADVNAAGSYFVMILPVAIACGLRPRTRIWTIPAVVLIVAGLWTSGSRTAIAAGLVAALLPVGIRLGPWRVRLLRPGPLIASGMLLVAAYGATLLLPHRGNQRSANEALQVRWELSLAATRMLATSPLFGVGIGNFYNLSGQFASRELLELFPPAQHENAHNNFAQIAAELGLVGLAGFGWLAVAAGRRVIHLAQQRPSDALRWSMVIGLFAFVLTCLGGHPLLIDEAAFSFWLLLGAAVGLGMPNSAGLTVQDGSAVAEGPTPLSGWRARWRNMDIVTALTIALAISVPLRWYSARAALDPSQVAFGLTDWYFPRDGIPYRLAGRTSLFYLPAEAKAVSFPIRATEPHSEIDLVIRVDGTVVEQTTIRTGNWQVLQLPLPKHSSWSRYRRLELEARTVPLAPRMLFIGRIRTY